MDSELHIVVPGICGPLAETHSIQDSPVLKNWVSVLAKSNRTSSASNVYDVTRSILNLSIEGDFPSAALSLLANNLYDDALFYMHADPVHLRAELDHAVLTSYVDLDIKETESADIYHTLNNHFHDDGLSFFCVNKKHWFVSSKNDILLDTTPLLEAVGRNVNFLLPAGYDQSAWKQTLTESQMLMHMHEVNETRENSGQQTINSLWFYGSGRLQKKDIDINHICSHDDLYKGLAKYYRCDFDEIPSNVSSYQDMLLTKNSGGRYLLHMSQLQNLTNYTDVSMWLEELTVVLNDWLYPLISFANKNNIKVILYPCDGNEYHFGRLDGFKFWCKGKVEEYVTRY